MSPPAPSRVVVRAPAKVNLALTVGPPRQDGYHDLATIFHAVSIFDEVVAEPADDLRLTVTGEDSFAVPADESNLAARAALYLAERTGLPPNVALTIHKRIPVAGGMAGGSADAAAALLACDALWGTGMGRQELHTIAAELGSDVPFGLTGGTALGLGRGERLTSALVRGTYHWVLGFADGGLSTPAVYDELDRLRDGAPVREPQVPEPLMSALRSGNPARVGAALHNDLQEAALSLRPALRLLLDAGLERGALGAVVSGSGPTCAFLASDEEHALDLVVALSASGTCRTVRRATGPVAGARIVEGG